MQYIYIFINIWVIWAICGLYGLYMEFNHVGATRSIVDVMVHFLWTLSIWHFFSPTGTLHSQDFHGFSALPNPGFWNENQDFPSLLTWKLTSKSWDLSACASKFLEFLPCFSPTKKGFSAADMVDRAAGIIWDQPYVATSDDVSAMRMYQQKWRI